VSCLLKLLLRLDRNKTPLSIDIETRTKHIACLGISWNDTSAICIPFMCVERDSGYWSAEEESIILNLLSKILTHPNLILIGQNFLFDAQYIWHYWLIRCTISHDTLIAQHLLYPGTELNLVMLSSIYNMYHRYWKDDSKFMDAGKNEDVLWTYNCRDCVVTWEVYEGQLELITQFNLQEQWGFQVEQQDCILTMMIRGVRIDKETKWLMSAELLSVREDYITRLNELLPAEFYPPRPKVSPWYTSHQQMTEIFTVMFGLKKFWNKAKRKFTMDDAALAHYGEVEPILTDLCTTLQQFRSLSTFRTFTDMPLSEDDRMRSSFSPTAETFRWKSSANVFGTGGNLQNLPTGQEQ
ncbi:MAG: hypothetical protein L3J79_11295, partial [Candidatus Marinimicrobia bacterium]|nr:hypothetical protein [Candidatus Neomarinimicrobiota bacterium]